MPSNLASRQFRVLYREFLFRMVDRDVLSAQAQGDASKLLGQLVTVLILFSLPFTIMALGVENKRLTHEALLVSAWSVEHSLIGTTMLVVGLFAVLRWDSMLPDGNDIMVLAPLPVRSRTIFLAKLAALGAALGLAAAIFNVLPSIALSLVLARPSTSLLDMILSPDFLRQLAAYWVNVVAVAVFVVCSVLAIQGLSAQLPRRVFLRLSAILQMMVLAAIVGVYFLQPALASPAALVLPKNQISLAWLPSYWFLGLFQELNGSANDAAHATIVMLARHALAGITIAAVGAGVAFLLSYVRMMRKIVEEPEIVPGSRRFNWLPRFGDSLATAIVQFSVRTLLRSRQHRLVLSFYLGIGFAILILFLKTPVAQIMTAAAAVGAQPQVSLPLLASSFIMMFFWLVGTRMVFAIPLELRANWIFRITMVRCPDAYFSGVRRAMYLLGMAPVWAGSAAVFLWLWPWRAATEHLAVLALVGMILVELSLHNFQKIPFTCSYLPGTSNLHITFWLCLMGGLNLTYRAAEFERRALPDVIRYLEMLIALCLLATGSWWRTWRRETLEEPKLEFEEELPPVILGLGLSRDGAPVGSEA